MAKSQSETNMDVEDSDSFLKGLKEAIETGRPDAAKDYFFNFNNQWKSVSVNMAVIGKSGVGKSSFIKIITGLKSIRSGTKATTMEPASYPHPDNARLIMWDLPGMGTKGFSKEDYLERIDVDKYDCFLIFTASRFYEEDAWFGKEIQSRNKKLFYVRTMIDHAIASDELDEDEPRDINETEDEKEIRIVERVRSECLNDLKEYDMEQSSIFLISNLKPRKFDFEALKTAIINDLPARQREVVVYSWVTRDKAMITEKAKLMRERAWRAAVTSGAIALVPIPGATIAPDVVICSEEVMFYFKELGLDERSLIRRANEMLVDVKLLKQKVQAIFPAAVGAAIVKVAMSSYAAFAGLVVEEATRVLLPGLGVLISSPISFESTRFLLRKVIDEMEKLSLDLLDFYDNKPEA